MPARDGGRRVGGVSVEGATLARLRQTRGSQEALVRWLQRMAPLLLAGFVLAGFGVDPGPGTSGRGLIVSVALAVFPVAVLGRNATTPRPYGPHLVFVVLLAGSALALMWAQPTGPGSAGVLLGALCLARLLPGPTAAPALVVAFMALLGIAAVTGWAATAWSRPAARSGCCATTSCPGRTGWPGWPRGSSRTGASRPG
jgi:hypothetical protein